MTRFNQILLLATLACILGIGELEISMSYNIRWNSNLLEIIAGNAAKQKPYPAMLNTAQETQNLKPFNVSKNRVSIFNGYLASPGQFPYIVSLLIPKSNGLTYRCGGFLYAPNLVLTAGNFYIQSRTLNSCQ